MSKAKPEIGKPKLSKATKKKTKKNSEDAMVQEDIENDTNILIEKDDSDMDMEIDLDQIEKPSQLTKKDDFRRVSVPPHRMTPLRNNWEKIVTTIVEN